MHRQQYRNIERRKPLSSSALNQKAAGANSNNKDRGNLLLVSVVAPSLKLLDKMKDAIEVLDLFKVPYDVSIVAAHRAPRRTVQFVSNLESSGAEVIIAGGAGSAHLPGMIASLTTIPVIGVPLQGDSLDGTDSLYSMIQMPHGVPVGAMGINAAYNAGIFACQILSLKYPYIKQKLAEHKQFLEKEVEAEDAQLKFNNKKKERKSSRSPALIRK